MSSFVAFINAFLSYLMVLIVFVAVGGLGCFIGLKLRKNKNAKEEALAKAEGTSEANA
ncbi:MAG: hypothetical protein IJ608_08670 [Lachnospiraceae bacterium]|nr:hypothetical protein [Lachnospiraceae bacterium]